MIHFTAFQGAGNLQSSINSQAGLGTSALATIYASLILSNIFLPALVIRKLGCKWAVAVSLIAYWPYIAAHFHASWGTLIPAAAIVGLGGGPLWCAKCTYITVVARAFSERSGEDSDVVVVRFMGYFFMIFQFAQVWGNLISSTVFSSGASNISLTVDLSDVCGANYYAPTASADVTNAEPPPDSQIFTVAGIYLGCMALAVLVVIVGVDSLSRYKEKEREGSGTELQGIHLLAVTMKLLRKRNQLLLLPITIFLGFGQAFIGADFTAAFVSCAWGISNIGYVMICYGVVNSASAVGAGWLVKLTGRLPVMIGAAVLHAGLLVTLLLWTPHAEDRVFYFIISGLWGACDGVWLVQVNALYGILFKGEEEAAFSNFRLWESLGYIVAYAYSAYIITFVKIYVMLVSLALGIGFYVLIEITERKNLRKVVG